MLSDNVIKQLIYHFFKEGGRVRQILKNLKALLESIKNNKKTVYSLLCYCDGSWSTCMYISGCLSSFLSPCLCKCYIQRLFGNYIYMCVYIMYVYIDT